MFRRNRKRKRRYSSHGDGIFDAIGDFFSALIFFSWLD